MYAPIFALLIIYQIKHFLADYPLQGKYMLGKFKPGWAWVGPLTAHAGLHGLFTLAIVLAFDPSKWWLAVFDFVIHFAMDRLKASPNLLGRYKALSGPEYMDLNARMNAAHEAMMANVNIFTVQGRGTVLREYRTKTLGNKMFWWSLGLDQMVHHLTHYFIIYMLLAF